MNDERSGPAAVPPHLVPTPVTTSRRGAFGIPGEQLATASGTLQQGAMHVQWEAPEHPTDALPLILVHGGGGQGTDWTTTPDGRPGWAQAFVAAGFPVYVVDRVGHGRSPHHSATVGAQGGTPPVEMTIGVFAPPPRAGEQTQWPWGRTPEDPVVQQLAASSVAVLEDFALANELDARRLTNLLDRTGPAVLVTHSLGAVSAWVAANRRSSLVAGIVAVEPFGPPFVAVPGLGALTWGITGVPLETDPPAAAPDDLRGDRRILGLSGTRIAVVCGSASPMAESAAAVARFLADHGARVDLLDLAAAGVVGNGHGHGLIFERNSDATAGVVIDWITATT